MGNNDNPSTFLERTIMKKKTRFLALCLTLSLAMPAISALNVKTVEVKAESEYDQSDGFGYEVKKLKRIRIMNVRLQGLRPGEYREIEVDELGLPEEEK